MTGYRILRAVIRITLRCYFREIRTGDFSRLAQPPPKLILPNHQNALLDALLLAAFHRGPKLYFLARADIFRGGVTRKLLAGLGLMPVYRWRDGRQGLNRNARVFAHCARVLEQGHSLVLFPEANHNLGRRVRPLSKGFTRVLQSVSEAAPGLGVEILTVGMNYADAAGFPDGAGVYPGDPISVPAALPGKGEDFRYLVRSVRERIAQCTTHFPDPETGADLLRRLPGFPIMEPDWLQPARVNAWINSGGQASPPPMRRRGEPAFVGRLFRLLNAPLWLPWHFGVKPRIPEPEFRSTFRYAYLLLTYPAYLVLIGVIANLAGGGWIAGLAVPTGITLLNLVYIKSGGYPT